MYRHRLLLTSLAAAFVIPYAVRAQSARKLARIRLLSDGGTTADMIGPRPVCCYQGVAG